MKKTIALSLIAIFIISLMPLSFAEEGSNSGQGSVGVLVREEAKIRAREINEEHKQKLRILKEEHRAKIETLREDKVARLTNLSSERLQKIAELDQRILRNFQT